MRSSPATLQRGIVAYQDHILGGSHFVVAEDVVSFHLIFIVLSVRLAAVKPKPPSAVAARGLTQGRRPKGWLGIGFMDGIGLIVSPRVGSNTVDRSGAFSMNLRSGSGVGTCRD
jgi:hypothetical protein